MTALIACPVCGHRGLAVTPYSTWPPPVDVEIEPPYNLQLGRASYEVCVRCGFEFGNDDDPGDEIPGYSFDAYRKIWQGRGLPWLSAVDEREHQVLDEGRSATDDCPVCLHKAIADGLPDEDGS